MGTEKELDIVLSRILDLNDRIDTIYFSYGENNVKDKSLLLSDLLNETKKSMHDISEITQINFNCDGTAEYVVKTIFNNRIGKLSINNNNQLDETYNDSIVITRESVCLVIKEIADLVRQVIEILVTSHSTDPWRKNANALDTH